MFSPSLVLHRADNTLDLVEKGEKEKEGDEEGEEKGPGNRRCYKKVMMVEQLEYQDVETCNHSYDKVCRGRAVKERCKSNCHGYELIE